MTESGIEVEVLHFRVNLVVIPAIMVEPVDRAHYARTVSASRTMNEEFSGGGVIRYLEKPVNILHPWVLAVAHRDVDISHTGRFDVALFIVFGTILQVDHCLDSECGKRCIIRFTRLTAAEKPIIHLTEILNFYGRECIFRRWG